MEGGGNVVNTNNQLYVQYNYRQMNCTMAYTESSRLTHLPRGKLWRSKLLCFFVPAQRKCPDFERKNILVLEDDPLNSKMSTVTETLTVCEISYSIQKTYCAS